MLLEIKTIATHNGPFHADDVFAVAILKMLFPKAKVIRTRDPEGYAKTDCRVDVGQQYNDETLDYDHHQKGGAGARENGIPYASCGLVWKHFGDQLVSAKQVQDQVDKSLIQVIDAGDNGVQTMKPVKDIFEFTLAQVISSYNPLWMETEKDFDARFSKAVEFAQFLLKREMLKAEGIVKARRPIQEAIDVAKDKRYIILKKYYPWQDTVRELSDEVLFVISPTPGGTWSVNAVKKEKRSFVSRKNLPESWAGKIDADLQKETGVADARFCHNGRFIAIADSVESAEKLAKLAVNQ